MREGENHLPQVRVNANLGARPMDEVLSQKKRGHLASFKYLLVEVERELRRIADEENADERLQADLTPKILGENPVDVLVKGIVQDMERVMRSHDTVEYERYTDDGTFRRLVTEMLDAGTMAVSKLRLYLEDKSQLLLSVVNMPLREAHRALISFLWRSMAAFDGEQRRAVALRLCRLQGLVLERIDEINQDGEAPLASATASGTVSAPAIRLLAVAGAALDGTALRAAAQYGNADSILALIGVQEPINVPNEVSIFTF